MDLASDLAGLIAVGLRLDVQFEDGGRLLGRGVVEGVLRVVLAHDEVPIVGGVGEGQGLQFAENALP
jgi:hypothetical protein